MNNYRIWDNEIHEKYETFIGDAVDYFINLDSIIKNLNDAENEKIKTIDYFSEMHTLNEGVADILLNLLRYADRAVFQYLVPTHKFLDDIESKLRNESCSINMDVFICYKSVVMGDIK
ncbi:hypothetical protein [Acetobacterium wieringae]|uniref:hypothetical protein n=1 Tax=Acetobacterium wieringae TaxID=52694 RepID=UPI0026EB758D|nr:hypothetical protein [Acetobacterium wieringae]